MAKAKKVVPEQSYEVHLTLTQAEAEALCAITYFIAGDPASTRRGLIDNIGFTLRELGVAANRTDIRRDVEGLYFR